MTAAGASFPAPAAMGYLAENIMHFARVLRRAGLPIGSDRVIDAIRAVELTGVEHRADFYWTLHAVFVDRHEQEPLFEQAFHIFWRDPRILDRALRLLLPEAPTPAQTPPPNKTASQRLADALLPHSAREDIPERESKTVEVSAHLRFSDRERLQHKDFDSMTAEELAAARRAIARFHLPLPLVRTRRGHVSPRGRHVDMRATLRDSLRAGSGVISLRRRAATTRPPALVVLCDISGSMAVYSRMFLHFLHALASDRERVHVFLFGTRLTNVTRHLQDRDVDVALTRIGHSVDDWAGGTRIGQCLRVFNRYWSRRVLGQGAVVLLISDGLDRDAGADLAPEMERLQKSCRRLVWLNPLLRYEGFEARPAGIRAMRPWVDDFRSVHNLESLDQLAQALSRAAPPRRL